MILKIRFKKARIDEIKEIIPIDDDDLIVKL